MIRQQQDPNFKWLVDRFNHLLFLMTGSKTPYTSNSGPADLMWQYRSHVAVWEFYRVQSDYQRIWHDDLVIDGELVIDGKVLII